MPENVERVWLLAQLMHTYLKSFVKFLVKFCYLGHGLQAGNYLLPSAKYNSVSMWLFTRCAWIPVVHDLLAAHALHGGLLLEYTGLVHEHQI